MEQINVREQDGMSGTDKYKRVGWDEWNGINIRQQDVMNGTDKCKRVGWDEWNR